MQFRLLPLLLFGLLATAADCLAQLSVPGLTPGTSTRPNVEQLLGQPVRAVSPTLSEYKSAAGPNKIYVQYSPSGDKVARIEIILGDKLDRTELLSQLGLRTPSSTKVNSRSKLEEFFSGNNIVISHEGAEETTRVARIAYYSENLFASATGAHEETQAGSRAGSQADRPPERDLNPDQTQISVELPLATTGKILPPAPPLGPHQPPTPLPENNVSSGENDPAWGSLELTEQDKENLIKALKLPPGTNFRSTGKAGEYHIPDNSGE